MTPMWLVTRGRSPDRVVFVSHEGVQARLGEVGADGARADAEIAGGPQHRLGPWVFGEREGGLRGRVARGLAGVDGAQSKREAGGGGLKQAG